ncbi:MAG TPA: AI-2E family transporter [Anaerolineae bacterium]|nr:AI-2E family transporter [Anaerolineae bacterium]
MSSDSDTPAVWRWPILIATIVIILAGMAWLSPVLTPLMLGVFFSALAAPMYQWLVRRKAPRWLALVILIAVLGAGLLGLALLLGTATRHFAAGLQTYRNNLALHLQELQGILSNINFTALADSLRPAQQAAQATDWVMQFLSAVISVVSDAVFALLVVAFLLLEGPHFEARFRAGLGEQHPLRLRMNLFGDNMLRYFLARTKLNLLTGLGVGIMYWVLGVEYAALWAVLAFVFSYVPYLGLTLASVPPVVLAFAQYGLGTAVIAGLGVLVINLSIENLIEPAVVGRGLHLSPLFVFVSFFFWGWILGPAGVFLSMPITVILVLILDSYDQTRWLANVVSNGTPSQQAPEA